VLAASGRVVRAPTTAPPRATRAEPVAPAAPGKPLATHVTEPPLPNFEQWGAVERQPLSHLRRTIAERMTLSATVIPHVTHFDRADITELDAIIQRNLETAKARGATLTLTAFLLRAAALALGEHPTFNASLDAAAGQLIVKRYFFFGVAATLTGLVLYKPAQLWWLAYPMGGYHLVRIWHFLAMCGFLSFIPGHLIMVALHGWNNFYSMLVGWKKDPEYLNHSSEG